MGETAEPDAHPVQEAAKVAAKQAEETGGLGRLGGPMDRRSPFFIGMAGAAGVAVTIGLVELAIRARSVLVLIGLALFIAAAWAPWSRGWPGAGWRAGRPSSRCCLGVVGIIAGFLAAAIPPLAAQTSNLIADFRTTRTACKITTHSLGGSTSSYHIEQRLSHLLATRGISLVGGVPGAGALVLGALASMLAVIVLVIYFLAGMPRIKLFAYRLAPHPRRARVILLGDEIFTKVGGFVLGNVVTSAIAGLGTYLWMSGSASPTRSCLGCSWPSWD